MGKEMEKTTSYVPSVRGWTPFYSGLHYSVFSRGKCEQCKSASTRRATAEQLDPSVTSAETSNQSVTCSNSELSRCLETAEKYVAWVKRKRRECYIAKYFSMKHLPTKEMNKVKYFFLYSVHKLSFIFLIYVYSKYYF